MAFRAAFLKITGQQAGETGIARGLINELKPFGDAMLATVEWDNPEIVQKVVVGNLATWQEWAEKTSPSIRGAAAGQTDQPRP